MTQVDACVVQFVLLMGVVMVGRLHSIQSDRSSEVDARPAGIRRTDVSNIIYEGMSPINI